MRPSLLLACVVGLFPLAAQAQTFSPPPCAPKTVLSPWASGTPWVRGFIRPATPGISVSYRAWWCPNADGTWSSYAHYSVDRLELTADQIEAEILRVRTLTDACSSSASRRTMMGFSIFAACSPWPNSAS